MWATTIIYGLAVLALTAAVPTSKFEKIHEEMTEDEVKQVFQTEPHAIPEYEVVPIHWPRLHKRSYGSSTNIRLNAFGKNINLWLNPTDGILAGYDTPIYLARSSPNSKIGVSFGRVKDPLSVVGKMLEDKNKQATLTVRQSQNGRNHVSGNIGSEGWTIRPVPDRFNYQNNGRWQRSVDNFEWLNNATIGEYHDPHYHIIYKNPDLQGEAKYISEPIGEMIAMKKDSRSKRSVPTVIYPQVLVFVDYATYQLHGEDFYRLLEYLLPFWNGVDLRYRSLENPKIRLNIAGIVIAMDANALPFVAKNKVTSKMLDIYGALNSFSEFMRLINDYFPADSYDLAVTMAPFDMCSPTDSGTCNPGTLGLAYLGGACDVREYPVRRSLSVAVIQDKGAFDGMHTAAHELGHLLGASHDGVDQPACAAENGHIMASSPVLTENSADWSACSLSAFQTFFTTGNPKCLFDKPKTSSKMPLLLPGRLLTIDQQCKKLEGTKMCEYGDAICMRLRCVYSKDSNYCTDVGDAAADGSTCSTGKICLHGRCVSETEIL